MPRCIRYLISEGMLPYCYWVMRMGDDAPSSPLREMVGMGGLILPRVARGPFCPCRVYPGLQLGHPCGVGERAGLGEIAG